MSEERAGKIGKNSRKLQPRLRMIANGDSDVNAMRSEQYAALAVTRESLVNLPTFRDDRHVEMAAAEPSPAVPETEPLKEIPDDVLVNVFIETVDVAEKLEIKDTVETIQSAHPEDARRVEVGVSAHKGNLATATVRLSQLEELVNRPSVAYVEPGQTLAEPTPIISSEADLNPSMSPRRFGDPAKHRDGEGVLIGIVDVQGFDFAHIDFLGEDKASTRFVRIWDQGGSNRPSPTRRATGAARSLFGPQFDYGSELRQEDMNAAIKAADEVGAPPQELEPQSQMDPRSHGTHVASIAAGNNGVCRKAAIAAVLISLPREDTERRRSLYDSTRIAHAVDYLFAVGKELDLPVSVNISLGTNGHAHDASNAVSRWLDSAVSLPGRSVCVAAGNAGQHEAGFPGDLGWVMGRVHTSGQIRARGLTTDMEWEVVGNGRADFSENELEIWYAPQDKFAVSIRPPGMGWIGPVEPGNFIENHRLKDEQGELQCVLSIYNDIYHAANGQNYIGIYLTPFLKEPVVGITAGTWILRLHGIEVRDGRFHGWIERDDPRRIGRVGTREAWKFPSFFSRGSNVDSSSVSSLACGQRIISVANLDEAKERIHITSSQGPTRDERFKPDVAGPGTDIVAAYGFGDEDQLWVKMTGTSMASPFVAGVAGLMLAIEPGLTAAQIEGIIHRTSRPLPGADFKWVNDAGFGRIDPEACLQEAETVFSRKEIKLT